MYAKRLGNYWFLAIRDFASSQQVQNTQKHFMNFLVFTVGVVSACIQIILQHYQHLGCKIGKLSYLRLKNPRLFEMNNNKCFVFEEVMESFFENDVSSRLEKLGPLHPSRLSKYVKKIHILMESKHCGYIVKHASGCHYEVQFAEVVTALEKHPCQYNIYYPSTNYSNDFLHIVADPRDICKYTNEVDWSGVNDRLTIADPNSVRQKHSAGYGFTGGQCNTYQDTINQVGVSEPRLRANTNETKIQELFLLMTRFSRNHKPKWLPKNVALWSDLKHPQRTENFAEKIVTGNAIESLYFGKTNDLHPCGCHTDGMNPSRFTPSLSAVSVLSYVTANGDRISLIGTMRLAVDHSLQSVSQVDQVMTDIQKYITSLRPCKRKLSFETFEPYKFEPLCGYSSSWGTCPIDPFSFTQVYLYYVPLIAQKYNLSFLEIISVQTSFDYFAKSPYYFGCSAKMILSNSCDKKMFRLSGAAFGYVFLRLMEAVLNMTDGKTPSRFSDYRDADLRFPKNYEEFHESVYKKVKLCLHVQSAFPLEPSDPTNSYKKVLNYFLKTVRGAGHLTCNHSLGMMACLGLMPKWIVNQCHIPKTSKYIKSIFKKYELGEITDSNISKFQHRVERFLRHCCNMEPTPRLIENLLCKFYRNYNKSSSDIIWKDCLMSNQDTIFSIANDSKVTIIHRDTKLTQNTQLPLILSFPFGQDTSNLAGLVQAIRLNTKKMPKLEKLFSYELHDQVCYNTQKIKTPISSFTLRNKNEPENNNNTWKLTQRVLLECDFNRFCNNNRITTSNGI